MLGLVEIGTGRPAVLQELLLSPEGDARLVQLRLDRREIGLRRAQRALLDLGVEPPDDLACRDDIADIDGTLDHASVEAKGEAGLVLGADLTGQRYDLAAGTLLHGNRSDRPGLSGRRGRFVATRDCRRDEQDRYWDPTLGHWLSLRLGRLPEVPAGSAGKVRDRLTPIAHLKCTI